MQKQLRRSFFASLFGAASVPIVGAATPALAAVPVPPIGSITPFAGPGPAEVANWEATNGWLHCNGRALNPTTAAYKALFAAIGNCWGGDGVNTFMIPDLQGYFLRGVSAATGRDPDVNGRPPSANGGRSGNNVGSIESDAFQGHFHGVTVSRPGMAGTNGTHDASGGGDKYNSDPNLGSVNVSIGSPTTDNANGSPRTSAETRPLNANVYYIIRYF